MNKLIVYIALFSGSWAAVLLIVTACMGRLDLVLINVMLIISYTLVAVVNYPQQ